MSYFWHKSLQVFLREEAFAICILSTLETQAWMAEQDISKVSDIDQVRVDGTYFFRDKAEHPAVMV